MINLIVADTSIVVRMGLKTLLNDIPSFNFVAEVDNAENLKEKNKVFKPDVLIVDTYSLLINNADLAALKKANKKLQVLAITQMLSKQEMSTLLNGEVTSYLLKECDKEEIVEAITATKDGNRFLCGKIVHVLTAPEEIKITPAYMQHVPCKGLSITEREADIIRHIAEGLSNKQIADKLYLSTHTVNTHRKNIMSKLGINNTAGIVMYAVKNNLLEHNSLLS